MQRFDWNDLQAFLAVVRAGRLTTAARLLDIDHSTLSRRIAGLEVSLGQTLFDRRSTGYVLTAEGERLVVDAEAMESLAIGMRARSDTGSGGLTGSVRLGVPEGFGTYFLAPKLAALAREHPQLEIELIANPRNFSLTKREADIAVAMSRPEQGHLHAYRLTDYEVGLYASRSYLDQNGPVYNRAELLQRTWVGYVDDQSFAFGREDVAGGSPVEQGLTQARFEPRDAAAQRRMIDVQQARGSRQPAGADHGEEGLEIVPIESVHAEFCT